MMFGDVIIAKRNELIETFNNYVFNLIGSAIDFFKDLGKRTLDRLVSFKDRAIERIKNIFDYLLKLPIAFFEGIKAMSNVFGEGTPAERFNKAFNDTLVGRDITDTIGRQKYQQKQKKFKKVVSVVLVVALTFLSKITLTTV